LAALGHRMGEVEGGFEDMRLVCSEVLRGGMVKVAFADSVLSMERAAHSIYISSKKKDYPVRYLRGQV